MKKIVTLLLTIMALVAFTGCGNSTSTKDSHETTDSHDVTTTTNTTTQLDSNSTDENGTIVDSNSTLEVPTFAGNSQGKIVVQCEEDIVYYIMAYDCLKADTKPTVTVDNGDLIVDEAYMHVGEVFYTSGHVDRTNSKPITVTGHVFSGGIDLPIGTAWVATCK